MEKFRSYTNEFLDDKRQSGDDAADALVLMQFSASDARVRLQSWLYGLESNRQLDANVNGNCAFTKLINSSLVLDARQLPIWADAVLMKRGSAFFARHAEAILNLLGLLSLPYCYAAADGAMVLELSERMRNQTGKRLFDTADFVWAVMAPDAFGELGKGFASILKVRIMHAAARFYTLKNSEWDSRLGFPLNQEDMAGTNLSLSLIVVRGLRKLGYIIQYEEQHAFMHLWNVIGSLLGIDQDLLPATGKQAQLLEGLIRRRQFKASLHGQRLTTALTDFYSSNLPGNSIGHQDVLGLMRFLLGDDVAQILGLTAPKLSTNQIRTLRAVNFVSDLKGRKNVVTAYNEAFRKFRVQRAAARPHLYHISKS